MTDAFDRIYGPDAAAKRSRAFGERVESSIYVLLADILNGATSWHYAPQNREPNHHDTDGEVKPLALVREIIDAWLDAQCPSEARWVFNFEAGDHPEIGTAIRALPRLLRHYTTTELSRAWDDGKYLPMLYVLDGMDPEFAEAVGQ